MRTVLAALIVSAATTSAASAGTYLGLGIGTGANASDSQGNTYQADGRSARLAVGYRLAGFSVEGAYSGYGLLMSGGQYDSRSFQIAGKYNLTLADHFELFGRLGLLQTSVDPRTSDNVSLSGTGYTLSVGVEYRLDLALTGLGIFMDWTRNSVSLETDSAAKFGDQSASMFTVGANISL